MTKRKRDDPQEEISSENVPFRRCELQYHKLCHYTDCYACYLSSFASSAKADFWNYDKNSCIPRDVTHSSHQKFWFTCNLCSHDFEAMASNITNGRWCPYCSCQKLCTDLACGECDSKSFASSAKRDFWNYDKNTCTPRDVTCSSHQKFWFTCNFCSHFFESALNHITNGRWCPYCSCKKLCTDSVCAACYSKSFASSEKRDFWNYDKNTCTPRDVTRSSHQKFWFTCNVCSHQFDAALNNITNDQWCPFCVNKTQNMVADFLGEHFSVKTESKFEWCKNSNGNLCRYDIEVAEKNCLIEVDGPQHFVDTPQWHSVATTVQENDIFKMKAALLNNMRVIRISQVDVWNNMFPWKTVLLEAVNSTALVAFISRESNLYNSHRQNYAQQ